MFEGGKFNSKREAIVGFALLAALFLAAVTVIWFIIWVFLGIDKTVLAAIIAGLVASFTAIFTYWQEKQKSIKEAHRDKKIEIYSKFIDIVFDLIENSKKSESVEETNTFILDETAIRWRGLHRGIMFYGSPNVLKSFADFRLTSSETPVAKEIMRATGKIILAMREDIGLSNKGLDELSIHQIYINDDITKMEILQ